VECYAGGDNSVEASSKGECSNGSQGISDPLNVADARYFFEIRVACHKNSRLKKHKECMAVKQVPGYHSAKSFPLSLSSSLDNEGVGGRQPMASCTGSFEGGTR